MDAQCGLAHNPIGAEIVYRTDLPVPTNGKPQKPRVDHRATVARLYQLGVIICKGFVHINKAINNKWCLKHINKAINRVH